MNKIFIKLALIFCIYNGTSLGIIYFVASHFGNPIITFYLIGLGFGSISIIILINSIIYLYDN